MDNGNLKVPDDDDVDEKDWTFCVNVSANCKRVAACKLSFCKEIIAS